MTTGRRWIAALSAVATVALVVAAVFIWVLPGKSDSDCATVRQLVDYNQAHNEKLAAQSAADGQSETSLSDLSAWASQLRMYTTQVTDPRLETHAEKLADIADQTVAVVKQSRADTAQSPGSGPPPWVQKYARLNVEFRNELEPLKTACPA